MTFIQYTTSVIHLCNNFSNLSSQHVKLFERWNRLQHDINNLRWGGIFRWISVHSLEHVQLYSHVSQNVYHKWTTIELMIVKPNKQALSKTSRQSNKMCGSHNCYRCLFRFFIYIHVAVYRALWDVPTPVRSRNRYTFGRLTITKVQIISTHKDGNKQIPGCLKCPFILWHTNRNGFPDQKRFQVLCFNLLIVLQKEVGHGCSSGVVKTTQHTEMRYYSARFPNWS